MPGHSFFVNAGHHINGSGIIEPFSRKAILSSLGPNILTNGDFETAGGVPWSPRNSAVLTTQSGQRTGGSGSLVGQVAWGGSNNPYVRQGGLTIGLDYRAIGWVKDDGVTVCRLGSSGSDNLWSSSGSGTWESFDVSYTAAGVYVILQHRSSGASFAQFDDISCHAL